MRPLHIRMHNVMRKAQERILKRGSTNWKEKIDREFKKSYDYKLLSVGGRYGRKEERDSSDS